MAGGTERLTALTDKDSIRAAAAPA